MTADDAPACRVWRGLPLARIPLHLQPGARASERAPDPQPDPAADIRAAWQSAFEEGAREGREQGLRSGYEEGLRLGAADAASTQQRRVDQAVAEAATRVAAQARQLAALAAALEEALQEALAAAEDELVALCYETLCRIVAAEALRPEAVIAQVRQLLVDRRANAVLAIHLHPDDVALLQDGASTEGEQVAPWIADPDVSLGGCILRLRAGALDHRLQTTLEECKAALLRARAARAGVPLSRGPA